MGNSRLISVYSSNAGRHIRTSHISVTPKSNFVIGVSSSQLIRLFVEGLKDMYWTEKALIPVIPIMIDMATSDELIHALDTYWEETKGQIKRVQQVFAILGMKATSRKSEDMQVLIKEAGDIVQEYEGGAICDAGIIAAGQKVEQYKIVSYEALRQFAETLGLEDAAALLQATLDEEKIADTKLAEMAVSIINVQNSTENKRDEVGIRNKGMVYLVQKDVLEGGNRNS